MVAANEVVWCECSVAPSAVRCACGVRAVCVRCACGVRAVCVRRASELTHSMAIRKQSMHTQRPQGVDGANSRNTCASVLHPATPRYAKPPRPCTAAQHSLASPHTRTCRCSFSLQRDCSLTGLVQSPPPQHTHTHTHTHTNTRTHTWISSQPLRPMLKPSILMSRAVGRELSTPVTVRELSRGAGERRAGACVGASSAEWVVTTHKPTRKARQTSRVLPHPRQDGGDDKKLELGALT